MNDPMAPSILRIASIKPRCWLLTASAAWSAPMTVILVWGNYPGMLHPVPGASGVCPSCPRPSADVRRAQEVAGDQQIENGLAPKLMGEVISKMNFILTESCLCVCLASCSGGGCNHCSIICCHLTVSGYWLIINQKKLVIIWVRARHYQGKMGQHQGAVGDFYCLQTEINHSDKIHYRHFSVCRCIFPRKLVCAPPCSPCENSSIFYMRIWYSRVSQNVKIR